MPIAHNLGVRRITRDEYHAIDYEVMEQVFDIQNTFGRLLDEKVYQRELFHRCGELCLNPAMEVAVSVSHGPFQRTYYADLVVGDGIIYELKAAQGLSLRHRSQLLQYLFLFGLRHGKLVNLGTPSVQYAYVTTIVGPDTRREFSVDTTGWNVFDDADKAVIEAFRNC